MFLFGAAGAKIFNTADISEVCLPNNLSYGNIEKAADVNYFIKEGEKNL